MQAARVRIEARIGEIALVVEMRNVLGQVERFERNVGDRAVEGAGAGFLSHLRAGLDHLRHGAIA